MSVVFDPLIPLWGLIALAGFAAVVIALAVWRGLAGWALRGLAGLVLLAALAGPSLRDEERRALDDIVIAVVDESGSQQLSTRPAQTEAALEHLRGLVNAMGQTRLEVLRVGDGPDNTGSRIVTALERGLAELPRGRVAGVFVISDGQVHDMADALPDVPAPLHLWRSGQAGDWDRRLLIQRAPAFGILGEELTIGLRIDDQGAAPGTGMVTLSIAIDGGEPVTYPVPVGEDLVLPLTLQHAGMNVVQISLPDAEGELTTRNNAAVVQINGVRDRLRVLLVSGEPHAGERTWRNLLKSDASVDLVHFTILRPPEKQDGVPVNELSLIAFPTRELFMEKIDEFDLIVFDRYKKRGILPMAYLENLRRYVENGGAVLVAAGPDYAGVNSIYRSPLGEILPGAPTARVVEQGFLPRLTDMGARHPVTRGLDSGAETPDWGRWFRQVEVISSDGEVLMRGHDDLPLLVLDRVGDGRVALLASDHAWLWSRGFEGGGPQAELLRRLAHWMMKEPELEEETLTARPGDGLLTVQRRSLSDDIGAVTVTAPDGSTQSVTLEQTAPGLFEAEVEAGDLGLYRLEEGGRRAVVALGPASPREYETVVASGDGLAPLVAATRGGTFAIADGLPRLRAVGAGRPAAGRGWAGIVPRGATQTTGLRVVPLLPVWAWLLLAAGLMIAAWLREGRR